MLEMDFGEVQLEEETMEKVKSVKFSGYKSFKEENQFVIGDSITLFIGKNNAGKSSVIDIVETIFDFNIESQYSKRMGEIAISFEVDDEHIRYGFREDTAGGRINGNHYSYGSKYIGQEVFFTSVIKQEFPISGKRYYSRNLSILEQQDFVESTVRDNWDSVARMYSDYGSKYAFRRINAERDIVPEIESDTQQVSTTGVGATNLIRMFINNSQYREALVQETILDELNAIMNPDAMFESIKIQQIQDGEAIKWEVFLTEKDGERFALSKSGSGLKTILLVLVNLFLIPELHNYFGKRIIYAFEELENNLHPALQRRLFDYLYKYSQQTGNRIVLTSHSHIAINCFFEKEGTHLYHVIKKGSSCIAKIESYIDKVDILNDLDVKASDLLQSNGIIWVEGPSDRIYIKRWLEVICDCKYEEGKDYQFLYYGGRLLSHYTADASTDDELISILITNRNSAIVIDSDKRNDQTRINDTKKRICREFEEKGMFCWITKGKEIENYIAKDAIEKKYGRKFNAIEKYTCFPEYIACIDRNFQAHKVEFARKINRYITKDNSICILDLKSMIERLYYEIEKWSKK